MRKFLSILCVLVVLFALCSCEPESKKNPETLQKENLYKQRRDNLNFHDAPFKDIMETETFSDITYYGNNGYCIISDEKSKSWAVLKNIPIIKDSCSATNSNESQLYVLARMFKDSITGTTITLPDNYCLFLVYAKVDDDITVNEDNSDQFYKWEGNYYVKQPTLAYYFKIAEPKYAFATRDHEIGMALEITDCWDVSKTTNQTEKKKDSDYLNGFVYFAREVIEFGTTTKVADSYSARAEVFRYVPWIGKIYDGTETVIPGVPKYLQMQYQNTKDYYNIDGVDTFNKDGETKEGWNTGEKQVAPLLGLSWKVWPEGRLEYEYPITPELNDSWINPLE